MISLEDKKQKLLTQRTLKKKVEDVILKVLFDSIQFILTIKIKIKKQNKPK